MCRNEYYGQEWATLMHRDMVEWIAEHSPQQSHDQPCDESCDQSCDRQPCQLAEKESLVKLNAPPQAISNLTDIIPVL